jgi:hypothetical protein
MIAPFTNTQVHQQETTDSRKESEAFSQEEHVNRHLCQDFRHSFWRQKRDRVRLALTSLHPGDPRLEAFENCGTSAWVLRSTTNPEHYRIRTNKCRDRFCDACAGEKRRLISMNLVRQLPNQQLRFLTFTLKSSARPLSEQIDRIYKSFRTLRNRKKFRKKLFGGISFLELTVNLRTGLWHPHLHVIASGQYIPKTELDSAWFSITGDSYITDIRIIHNTAQVAGYLTKYASKLIPGEVWRSPKHLAEAITDLDQRRTFNTFGTWKSLELSKKPDDGEKYVEIASLAEILRSAFHYDPIAMDILAHLRKTPPQIDDDPPPTAPPT